VAALHAALNDRTRRPPLARALMQADLWSAHDGFVSIPQQRLSLSSRATLDEVTTLIARLIGHISLTRDEIAALPDNYRDAQRSMDLPDLFRDGGDWLEFIWTPLRMHDHEAHHRRAARIMIRPRVRPPDVSLFLSALRDEHPVRSVSAAALVEQLLLIDRTGRVVPSPIVQKVEIRTFGDPGGVSLLNSVRTLEVSRRRILSDPSTGGFVPFDDTAEAYLPVAGNDYGFATPHRPQRGSEPTMTTLHVRCTACHGPDNTALMSLRFAGPPESLPPVRTLRQPNDEHARAVASAKQARDDYKRLVAAAFPR
jgi:hypothetical protein